MDRITVENDIKKIVPDADRDTVDTLCNFIEELVDSETESKVSDVKSDVKSECCDIAYQIQELASDMVNTCDEK